MDGRNEGSDPASVRTQDRLGRVDESQKVDYRKKHSKHDHDVTQT